MAQPSYASILRSNSAKMSETYTELTEFGDVRFHYDGVSPFETVQGKIGGIEIGTRVCLRTSSCCLGTVKWLGCPRGVRPDGCFLGVKLDDEKSASDYDRTFGIYCDTQLVHTSRKDMMFRGIGSWDIVKEEKHSEHANAEVEKLTYQRQSPRSKFNRIVTAVNGFQDGSKVRLRSGTTGTVKWIGCYRKKEMQLKDCIVGVELDSASKEDMSLLTNGLLEGEQLVHSDRVNINFVRLRELTSLSVPQKSSQQELQQKMDAKSRDPLSHGKPGYVVPVTPAASSNPMRFHQPPAFPGWDKSKQEFPVMNNQPSLRTQNAAASSKPVVVFPVHQKLSQQEPNPRIAPKSEEKHSKTDRDVVGSQDTFLEPRSSTSKFCRILIPVGDLQDNSGVKMKTGSIGTIRWMGCHIRSDVHPDNCIVGVEVDLPSKEDISLLTNGRYEEEQLIQSQKVNVMFVKFNELTPLSPVQQLAQPESPKKMDSKSNEWQRDQLDAGIVLRGRVEKQKDNTYLTNIVPLDKSEGELIDFVGDPLADVVEGYALPPTHKEQYRGRWKGVQGDQNSGYMDASIFAMFSFLSVFDNILFDDEMLNKHSKFKDREQAKKIRSTLLRRIVNPLRKYGLVQKQGMHELRRQLDEWGLVRGLTGDEKDPEEFLNLLLVHTFSTPPPIRLSNGQESHLFHLLAEKEEGMTFPTVQELVERTCLQEAFKFRKIPPYLILHLPRWGKDFKMYDYVMPNLELNITDVLCGTRQTCYVCGNAAYYECYGCYKDTHVISDACFCHTCAQEYHSNAQRSSHKPQKLASVRDDGVESPKCVLKLAAVLCIETSHYVTFVASDTTPYARWYFFDSMADRQGTSNIPEVTELKDFRASLKMTSESMSCVSPQMRRFVKDGYICFYSNPDIPQYLYARPESSSAHGFANYGLGRFLF